MIYNGVKINCNDELQEEEIKAYVERADKGKHLIALDIKVDGEYVDLHYHYAKPFERIRRITGYLVGDVRTWNDAKRAELNDRVKHG